MGDHDNAAPEASEPLLQPLYHIGVEMVGGLVQQQHVRRMDQRGTQGHTLPLPAGQGADFLVIVRQAQLGQHGFRLKFLELPKIPGKAQKYLLQNAGVGIHLGVLPQIAHLHIGVPAYCTLVRCFRARQQPQQGTLSGAVDADHANFLSLLQIDRGVLQQGFHAIIL